MNFAPFKAAALASATALAISFASAASAAARVEATGFTMTYVDGPMQDRWAISLASDGPSGAVVSLDTVNEDMGPSFGVYDFFGNGTSNGNYHSSALRVDVQPGYRIANLTLAGTAYGELLPGTVNGVLGVARNEVSLVWTITANGDFYAGPVVRYLDVAGQRRFAVATDELPFGRSFYVTLLGVVDSYAEAAWDDTRYDASYALGALSGATLTVDVVPVPEPGTYLMLLGGLALLAALGRRRASRPGEGVMGGTRRAPPTGPSGRQ